VVVGLGVGVGDTLLTSMISPPFRCDLGQYNFRTIMASSCPSGPIAENLWLFSNPDITRGVPFQGEGEGEGNVPYPIGNAATSDCARTISSTAVNVSLFRTTPQDPPPPTSCTLLTPPSP
jgi:hypothetical protein